MHLRDQCDSLMTNEELLELTLADARLLTIQKQTHEEAKANTDVLPTVDVPKLVKGNWYSFHNVFIELLSRQVGLNGIPLSCVIRESEVLGDYNAAYTTLNDKLINCI